MRWHVVIFWQERPRCIGDGWCGSLMDDVSVVISNRLHPADLYTKLQDLEVQFLKDIFTNGSNENNFLVCVFVVMRVEQVVSHEQFRAAAFCSNNLVEQLTILNLWTGFSIMPFKENNQNCYGQLHYLQYLAEYSLVYNNH